MNEQDLAKRFARAIRLWRHRLNMEPKEFAEFVGTSKRTIYNYESGHYMPQLHTAALIAEKLGISLDDLIRGE